MPKTAKPNPRRKMVYDFICRYKSQHDGNSPTLREICKGAYIGAPSQVIDLLLELQGEGLIKYNPKLKSRCIEVVGSFWQKPEQVHWVY